MNYASFFKTLIHWKGPQATPSDVFCIWQSNTSPLCSPTGALHGKTVNKTLQCGLLCKSPTCSPDRNSYSTSIVTGRTLWWEEVGITEGGKCPGRWWGSWKSFCSLCEGVGSLQEIQLLHECFLSKPSLTKVRILTAPYYSFSYGLESFTLIRLDVEQWWMSGLTSVRAHCSGFLTLPLAFTWFLSTQFSVAH